MNMAVITGRLTHEPEIRRTAAGVPVATFTVASDRPNEKDKTDFIRCYAWRSRAEFLGKYFHKGQRIEVCGPVTSRSYEKDGEKRIAVEIRCDHVAFGGFSRSDAAAAPEETAPMEDFADMESDDSELPF